MFEEYETNSQYIHGREKCQGRVRRHCFSLMYDIVIVRFFNEQTRVVTLSNVCSLKGKRGVKSLCSLMNGLYTEE